MANSATYIAKDGQSIYDVCMQTYGTLNLIFKLLKDNLIESLNANVRGTVFSYDPSLTYDFSISKHNENEGIVYVTNVAGVSDSGLLENADGFILDTADGIDIAIA